MSLPGVSPGPCPGAVDDAKSADCVRIELVAHCSLDPRDARAVLAFSAAVAFTSAGIATLFGAWPVLVFAALSILVLHWALRTSLDRARDGQIVEITEDHVRLITCLGATRSQRTFLRHWTRVRWIRDPPPAQLVLECSGKRCEIGAFLSEAERYALAGRLQRLIGRTAESPALER